MTEKAKFLKRFNEAFSKNDQDFILENLSDHIVWNMVGDKIMEGKLAVETEMQEMKNIEMLAMKVATIITHGKNAAVDGHMKIKEASGKVKSYDFCDLYEFSGFKNPKIKKMTSYVVPVKEA